MNPPLIEIIDQLARQSVEVVFKEMLGITVRPDEVVPLESDPEGQIISSVGFIGQVNGIVHLAVNLAFARHIAGHLLGIDETEFDGDEMVNDAMGELANVVVGRVKSQLCDQGRSCTLTVPSIVRGQRLTLGETSGTVCRLIGFRNGQHRLLTELVVKEAQS